VVFDFNKMRFFALPAALCIAIVASAPSSYHVVHERREIASGWVRRDLQIDRRAILPTFSIALTQQLLQVGEQFLMDVSDPTSANYGQHWTTERVVDTFAPEQETIDTVKTWLIDSGISEDRIQLSPSRNWLRMNLTIAEAENLLKTEYRVFEHKETARRALAVEEYSVPGHVKRHIDYITPTLQGTELTKAKPREEARELQVWDEKEMKLPPKFKDTPPAVPSLKTPIKARNVSDDKVWDAIKLRVWNDKELKQPPKFKDTPPETPPLKIPSGIKGRDSPGVSSLVTDLTVCGDYVTLACIQSMYNMPIGTLATYAHSSNC
jgi:hypothetical protein